MEGAQAALVDGCAPARFALGVRGPAGEAHFPGAYRRATNFDRRVSLVTVEARIPSNCEPLGDAVSPEPLALNAAWKGFSRARSLRLIQGELRTPQSDDSGARTCSRPRLGVTQALCLATGGRRSTSFLRGVPTRRDLDPRAHLVRRAGRPVPGPRARAESTGSRGAFPTASSSHGRMRNTWGSSSIGRNSSQRSCGRRNRPAAP